MTTRVDTLEARMARMESKMWVLIVLSALGLLLRVFQLWGQ